MTNKRIILVATLLIVLALISLIWQGTEAKLGTPRPPDTELPHRPQSTDVASVAVLRFKPQMHPAYSKEAANAYYARRESLIRGFHGNAQIDKVMENLKSGRDSIRWIGKAQRQEMIQALPLIAEMLNHQDEGVRRVAAQALCWFGDKRGFDFVMSQMEGSDSQTWWSIFDKDFGEQNPSEYVPRMKALLMRKADVPVEQFVIAKVLAKLGDADSLKYLLPVIEREPHMSIETILRLANVRDPSVTSLMQKLSSEGSTNNVKHAADVVLASQGDTSAQQRLIEVAKRVTGLPQPRNVDGTGRPGMIPKFIGEATPAWDGNAVFALEHGMLVVDPAQAVPVLRDIAVRADNVRFSQMAIEHLAKIGNEAARAALWEVARSVEMRKRPFEETLFTITGKALTLFNDDTSASLATTMFSGDHHGMEVSRFLAETRGWDGLFKLKLFY
jgi:HEAT repeat protein